MVPSYRRGNRLSMCCTHYNSQHPNLGLTRACAVAPSEDICVLTPGDSSRGPSRGRGQCRGWAARPGPGVLRERAARPD